ncbi:MAG: ATP-binding protein [Nocardioidaceae bacterium]
MKRAPSLARKFVRQYLCAEHAFAACSASELLLSEIVTLAVYDGEGPVKVTFGCRASTVVLAVTCASSSPELPWFDGRRDDLPLMIAHSIARQWGTSSDVAGDTLWHIVPTGYIDFASHW